MNTEEKTNQPENQSETLQFTERTLMTLMVDLNILNKATETIVAKIRALARAHDISVDRAAY